MSETASQKPRDKIGSGRNVTTIDERIFKRGTLMFIEGETSSEMFILRTGKIKVLKQEGDKTIELAVLGAGSVLGELSLLDHQPRSATAQVIEDVNATVIDDTQFDHTMKTIPSWLANIIQVVVRRLRDTMKKSSDSIVQKSVAGVIRILLLLYTTEAKECNGQKRILVSRAKDAVASTIGIGDIETENVFLHLILKDMLYIRKDDSGREYIVITNFEVLQLYMNYLRSAQRGIKILGENLTDAGAELIQLIVEAGDKGAKEIKPGIKKIGQPQIEIESQRQGKGQYINLDAVDELVAAKIVFKEEDAVKTAHQSHKRIALLYNESTLKKLITLHIWLPKFKEEIQF